MLDSESMGDPERFLSFAELCGKLALLRGAPTNGGRVVLIVSRRDLGRRELPARLALTPEGGVPGDAWSRRAKPDPAGQIAVIQADVAGLIANGQPLELFGDNLVLDLDLSAGNLPPGSRVRVGDATLEITPKPHNGCKKFLGRFGPGAHQFVWDAGLRHRNFRGIYMRVVEAGEVGVGDPVEVMGRAQAVVGL